MKYLIELTILTLLYGCGSGNNTTVIENSQISYEEAPQILSGNITKNLKFNSFDEYEIQGKVVANGVNILIEEGSVFTSIDNGYLLIAKDATIDAQGSQQNPIVFKSVDFIILANAQTNQGEVSFEGIKYANENDDYNRQSSGKIKYIDIQDGSFILGAVGAATTVEHIKVENSKNDGIKIIGGAVNPRYIQIVNAKEDSLDISGGYSGTIEELNITQNQPAEAAIEISSGFKAPYTETLINNFEITTVPGSVEGAIYLKDNYVLGTFANGTINHFGNDGIINTNTTQYEDVGFKDVELKGTNTQFTGSSASQIKQRYLANDADPDACECEKQGSS